MTRRKGQQQLLLPVRLFRVRCDSLGEIEIQAVSAAAAKYQAFRRARDAGYFQVRNPFRDFLDRGWTVRELQSRSVT